MTNSNSLHPARRAALRLLVGVTEDKRTLAELVGDKWFAALPSEDKARSQRLALETLRNADRADRVLKPFMPKTPPEPVRQILRLGLVEVAALGAPAHGVVNEMVAAAAMTKRTRGFKGMVNAVLRRAVGEADGKWGKLPVPRLPVWLRKPLAAAYGNSAIQAIEAAHMRGAPLDFTAKQNAEAVAEALGATLLPTGTARLRDTPQISTLPGYAEGDWWIQDAAAALPVRILAPQPGEKVADLCAAPGGKTLQLSAAGAEVTSVDLSAKRLERVAQNLERMGLSADLVQSDLFDITGRFDAVLLDAPCSATGTIRRHPDLPHARDGAGISELIALQARMLDHAVDLLAPGGRLVFCTCSLLPDEGEVQVEEALLRHDGLSTDRDALALPGLDPAWVTEEGGLRLRPDYWAGQGGMDGFYIACIRKP